MSLLLTPYHEYLMFIPTVFLLLGGMAFRMGIWLEENIEGTENGTKWGEAQNSLRDWIPFGGNFLSQFLRAMKLNADFLWYFHVIPSLVFFIYIPHIFTTSVTVFAARQKEWAK